METSAWFRFLTIAEASGLPASHVMCSDTPASAHLIERIDAILPEQRPTQEYRSIFENWLDPAFIPAGREADVETFVGR